MKILVTFEHGGIAIHCIDFLRLLKHRGHEVHFFKSSSDNINDPFNSIPEVATVLQSPPKFNQYDVWFYDLTSWETPTSPFVSAMEEFKGKLACMNYEDGYDFFAKRTSQDVAKKTLMYMNNTIRINRPYPPEIQKKLFLTTSYITNSQIFKDIHVPFEAKQKRAFFTGNITGHSESGNPEELRCRIKVPMSLAEAGIPIFYRIYNSDPNYTHILSSVPTEYRQPFMGRMEFCQEMANSMIVLALRGNGHTVNRFFEGLASGSLVFYTKFRHAVEFIGHGIPGIHFVEIDWDGSDVVEKAHYYFNHPEEAAKIAANGRKLWEEYSMLDENKVLPKKLVDYHVNTIRQISGIEL